MKKGKNELQHQAEKGGPAHKQSLGAAMVGLISNALLTVLKLTVGLVFKSEVLIADGVHNAGDVIASAAALSSMRISNQPADEDHPYGHGKAEVVSSGIVAGILGIASIYIFFEAIAAFLHPPTEAHMLALVAAVVSLLWKQALYVYTMRIGKKANSKGLIATAYDHLADVYASLAAAAGIGAALIGERYDWPLLAYGDPAAGIIVALLILKLAYGMGKEAVDILMEKNVNPEQIEAFSRLVLEVDEVKRIDRLRAREHGHYILVDARVSVLGTLSIQDGHDISRKIKKRIMDAHPTVDEVLVHLNPWYPEEKRSSTAP